MQEKKSALLPGLGSRIKYVRELNSISQGEMANRLGLSSYISYLRYEKDQRIPKLPILEIIANLGKTTVQWLKTGEVDIGIVTLIELCASKFNNDILSFSKKIGISEIHLLYILDRRIAPSILLINKICEECEIDSPVYLPNGKIKPNNDEPFKHKRRYYLPPPNDFKQPQNDSEKLSFYINENKILDDKIAALKLLYRELHETILKKNTKIVSLENKIMELSNKLKAH
jgi:transcriptional regulator with XRE-family HTH domain